jgi:DNA (cytosine-5)-methyltransferase 1
LCVLNKSVTDVTGEELLSLAHLKKGEVALVIGGPPCQSFSLAGLRKGLDDERGKLLFEFVRIVRETLPKGFVLENVRGLANWDKGKALDLLLDELSKPIISDGITYQYDIVKPQILNAVDYGVPQYRERLIVVGNRIGKGFLYPAPDIFSPQKTVWDAIGNLPAAEAPSDVALRVSSTIKERRKKYGY